MAEVNVLYCGIYFEKFSVSVRITSFALVRSKIFLKETGSFHTNLLTLVIHVLKTDGTEFQHPFTHLMFPQMIT